MVQFSMKISALCVSLNVTSNATTTVVGGILSGLSFVHPFGLVNRWIKQTNFVHRDPLDLARATGSFSKQVDTSPKTTKLTLSELNGFDLVVCFALCASTVRFTAN